MSLLKSIGRHYLAYEQQLIQCNVENYKIRREKYCMKYEIYGKIHKIAKKLTSTNNDLPKSMKLISFPEKMAENNIFYIQNAKFVNEKKVISGTIKKSEVYPVENLVNSDFDSSYPVSFRKQNSKNKFSSSINEAVSLWPYFLDSSVIESDYRNSGIHYAGYILDCQKWCLPSWIWTNAALVRYFCSVGEITKAKQLGDLLIEKQHECGGWIVRNDYNHSGSIPQLAPNDSCYIALNCCLSLYDYTHDSKYLDSAIRNANWVEKTTASDGLVWFSYDIQNENWIKNKNIVDIGFTAGLFARLYELTEEKKYITYLNRFINAYIKAFYMPRLKCFSTAIDTNGNQYGGAFGRGQGWALEGLIPAYRVIKNEKIKKVIDECVDTLLCLQLKNGGWSYNLLKPIMGEDCKAVPVIAKCLIDWYELGNPDPNILNSVNNALKWCAKHTITNDKSKGGIFSYSIEGAVVHHMYTSTAFVYSSSYALEVYNALKKIEFNSESTI